MNRRHFLRATAASTLLLSSSAPLAIARGKQKRPRHPKWAEVQETNARTLATLLKPPPKNLRKWEWLIVHHTAAENASLEGISAYHRKRFEDPLGIQYHFLIGNGRRAPRGLIQVARWQHQERAVHLFHPERAPNAVTVCLTGNLEERKIHAHELEALVALSRVLTKGLGIPKARISTHTGIDGRLTQCPGKHFPLDRFLEAVIKP